MKMPGPMSPLAERILADSEPLSSEIVDELSRRSGDSDAVALRDPDNKIFAIMLSPQKFDLLQALSELAASGRLVLQPKQKSDVKQSPMDLLEYIKRL